MIKKATKTIKKNKVKKLAKKPVVKKQTHKDAGSIKQTKIKLVGIGGGGCSIVSEISSSLKRIDFIVANTDAQALKKTNKNCKRLQFGEELTQGLGCGMNPELGKKSAENEREKIKKMLEGADFCILVSCLGGGAGSGASPIFADICKELKIISFGIFTLPFKFEGEKKAKIALTALEKIKPNLNGYTIVPNEKIFQIIDKSSPLLPGLINIDWSDLKTILQGQGKLCFLNSQEGKRSQKPEEIIREVLHSKLNAYNIDGAEKILYNIASDKDLTMEEVQQISEKITDFNPKAKIIFGVSFLPKYKGKIKITLLAVGCGEQGKLKERAKRIKEKIAGLQIMKSAPDKGEETKEDLTPEATPSPKAIVGETEKIKEEKPRRKPKKDKPKIRAVVKSKPKPRKPKPQVKKISNPLLPQDALKRKNALEIKKEAEDAEKKLLEQEEQWETPAYLRKS
jgi:cell division protein FtsZ